LNRAARGCTTVPEDGRMLMSKSWKGLLAPGELLVELGQFNG
jgi:hypothetical protein